MSNQNYQSLVKDLAVLKTVKARAEFRSKFENLLIPDLQLERPVSPWVWMLRPAVLGLLLLLSLGGGTVWAAYWSQPGDLIYPVKEALMNLAGGTGVEQNGHVPGEVDLNIPGGQTGGSEDMMVVTPTEEISPTVTPGAVVEEIIFPEVTASPVEVPEPVITLPEVNLEVDAGVNEEEVLAGEVKVKTDEVVSEVTEVVDDVLNLVINSKSDEEGGDDNDGIKLKLGL